MSIRRKKISRHDRRLIDKAAEPVPAGSGITQLGDGKYSYVKISVNDGSTRIFSFKSQGACHAAMAEGVAADEARALARLDPDRPQA